MDTAEIFRRLGYPKHADMVYHTLSTQKESISVTEIARHAKLPRATVYRCLDQLLKYGVVEQTKVGKRTFYSAGSPRQLTEAMKLTETASERTLSQYVTEREKDVPSSVRFLHGPAGIRAAFDDVISHSKRGETFFRYTSEQDLAQVNQYLARDYRARRDKKKLERKVISNAASGSQKRSRLERFIRFIPAEADQFEQNIIQLVYGKRLSIIDLEQEEVTIIENERLAEFQKVIFRLLYERL